MNSSGYLCNPVIWFRTFLKNRTLEHSDGRPLYEYRCSYSEFREIKTILFEDHIRVLDRVRAGLFCLYAAEWWRRNHKSGPWKWYGILEDIRWESISYPRLYKTILNGLRLWEREILKVGPNRAFLVTLACEGGLPLHLVTTEGTALRNYLLQVLEEFQLHRNSGFSPVELAYRASDRLPYSLQHDVVYQLSGQLIDEIWKLQSKVRDSSTPVRDLDRDIPNWRERLPLIVPDNVARTLLNPLIEVAVELVRGHTSGFRMNRTLRSRTKDSWELCAEIIVPPAVSGPKLVSLLGNASQNLPTRFDLYLQDSNGDRIHLALVTQTDRVDPKQYRIETLKTVTRIVGSDCRDPKSIYAVAPSYSVGPVPLLGGNALLDLPWVFVDKGRENGEYSFVGQGTVRTKYSEVYVVIPRNTKCEAGEYSECELVAQILDPDLAVLRVRGSATFQDADCSICRIQTACNEDSVVEYRMVGEVLHGVTSNEPVYLGCPSLHTIDYDGIHDRITEDKLEWCVSGTHPVNWRKLSMACYGSVSIRYMDNSVLRHRERISIVPRKAEIQLKPSSDFKKGKINFDGFEDVNVIWDSTQDLKYHLVGPETNEPTSLICDTESEPPSEIPLKLEWPGGRKLNISVPYPSSGGRFVSSNSSVFEDEEIVPLDRLSGIIATYTTLDDSCNCHVSAKLIYAADITRNLEVREPLKKVLNGRFELNLQAIQEPLRGMFALSRELDIRVRLVIETSGRPEGFLRRLIVSRFDLDFTMIEESGEICLNEHALGRLNIDELRKLRVEAAPLWKPDIESTLLEESPQSSELGRWLFSPQIRDAGPWLILGKDGDWIRIRPFIWEVPGWVDKQLLDHFNPQEEGSLTKVLCISDSKTRKNAIDSLLQTLAQDCEHQDWDLVFTFLHRFREIPPAALDLTDRFISTPNAAIMALLLAPNKVVFEYVWSVLEELPFMWTLLPVKHWVMVARNMSNSLHRQLKEHLDEDGIEASVQQVLNRFIDEAPKHQLGFEILTDLVKLAVLGCGIESTQYLKIATNQQTRNVLTDHLRYAKQDLVNEHTQDRWPIGWYIQDWLGQVESVIPNEVKKVLRSEYMEGQKYQFSVINAPIVTAISAACGIDVQRPLIYELRRLRNFDEQWFDVAYSCFLSIVVGIMYDQNPEQIGLG